MTGAIATVISAFTVEWSNGGGGSEPAPVKRSLSETLADNLYHHLHSNGTVQTNDPLNYMQIKNGTKYIRNLTEDTSVYFIKFDNGKVAQGARISQPNLFIYHSTTLSNQTKRTEEVDTVWGVGDCDNIHADTITNQRIALMASSIKEAQDYYTGHTCSSIYDGNELIGDIKFAFYDNSYSPTGSACSDT